MAKIKWQKKASRLLDERVAYATAQFGKSTAKSYAPEPLLVGKKHVYRYCHLMNRRFKLIYCYYPSSETARIVDIWDTFISFAGNVSLPRWERFIPMSGK